MSEDEPQLTPRQFMDNVRGWEPDPELKGRLSSRLTADGMPATHASELSGALHRCATASFKYIRLIHDYATDRELNPRNFIPALAELVEHLQDLRDAGSGYVRAFLRYDETAGPGLKNDEFDTLYYDIIQGVDLKEYLNDVLKEVGLLLAAMTLTSAELKGARLTDLFEMCVRYQLYLRYFLMSDHLGSEETWSVLFDVYNLFEEEAGGSPEALQVDLDGLEKDLEWQKKLN